jgi:hypothetical protein
MTAMATIHIPSTNETFQTEVTASDRNNIRICLDWLFPNCRVLSIIEIKSGE